MTTTTLLEQRTIEPIVLGDLSLDSEAVRGADGKYLLNTPREWMDSLAGSGARLPTMPEYFAFIHHLQKENLQKENHPASEGLLQDLQKDYLCTGTRFRYHHGKNTITHFGDEPRVISCTIPEGNGYLDELVKYDAWREVVQTAFAHPDADEVIKVLQRFSGKRTYIWTAWENRKSYPERAVWLFIDTDRFRFYCDSNPIYGRGRARRVRRVEDATGGALKNVSPNVSSPYTGQYLQQRTYDEIMAIAKPLVAEPLWNSFTKIVPREAPVTGDVLQRTIDEQYMSQHSWEQFKKEMEKLR